MAELTLTTFLTLDGVMQAAGGPSEDTTGDFPHGGWLVPHADEEMGKTMDDIFSKAEAFLLGRTTYDIFAAYWPRITDTDELVANQLNSLPKYVASRTRTTFDWYGSSLIQDVVGEVGELKQRYSGEIQVHGSCGLAQTLIQHDLIDEYRLLIFPVILGTGKRLFGSGTVPSMLKLVSSSNTSKGTIVSVYRRAGKLQTGSFALD
ncbi:dihydrofolate reductase family protein [Leptothermofonsia sichuanensis E412]|uniref:dihydrofolate reductase family protein n=1 Tax=Leptothermofonsia sichuanensis TaxID=2917832 RepID=UPI001CA62CDC|nr:dihydrofolate reductase family protein [Leptothermofonsia sichuanensis]QZZ19635.1 dihydrofolate reductase family protein [Leptothermofonsia sichuanensis E412]